jgi:hypothetical protein
MVVGPHDATHFRLLRRSGRREIILWYWSTHGGGQGPPLGGIMAPTHPGCAADPIETPGEESIHAHSHPVRFRPAGADRKSPFNGCRRKPGRSTFSVEAAAPNTKKNVFDLFAHVGAH